MNMVPVARCQCLMLSGSCHEALVVDTHLGLVSAWSMTANTSGTQEAIFALPGAPYKEQS